jgi:hypothetical protein
MRYYPLLIEPHLRLADQSRLWTFGYGVLVALVLGCAVIVWRWPSATRSTQSPGASHNPAGEGSAADNRCQAFDRHPCALGRPVVRPFQLDARCHHHSYH